MKRILSVFLCLMLLMTTVSVSAVAATVDTAASGDDDYVFIDIYLYADAEYPVASAQYNRGEIPQRPEDPGREDEVFVDWYTSPSFTTRFDFSKPLYEDTAMYARFAEPSQVIGVNVFESPDAEEPMDGYLCVKGDRAEYPSTPDYDEDAYSFFGWYSDRALTQEYDFSQPLYDYLYLFPRFVAYDDVVYADLYLDPASEYPVASMMIEKGDLCTVPAEPGRENEVFLGWYTDRALTKPMDFTKPVYSDFQLFPKFEPIHYHDLVMVDEVPATGALDGCKAHLECTTCGKWFEPIYSALIEIKDHESLVIPATGPYLLGDADGDDEVDITDATKMQRYLVGILPTGGFCRAAADVDGDEEISSIDVTYIQRYQAFITTPYAIGQPMF